MNIINVSKEFGNLCSTIVLFFCILISSCSFDDDSFYLPQTRAVYFLYQDSVKEEKRLMRIEQEEINKNWQEKWEINSKELGDMSAYEQELWIADSEKRKILEIDPSSGSMKREFQLQMITPHYICVGADQILISDSTQNIISFWDKKKEKVFSISVASKPGFAVYRSQKFFITYDERKVLMYHEKALQLIDSLSFLHPITDLQLDNGLYTIVFGRQETQNFQAFIDYNTHAFSSEVMPTNIVKARYTPYNRQIYGLEFLADQIMDQNRKLSAVENIQDFETNFFEGDLYFRRNDTLSVFNHWQKTTEVITPFHGIFLKSYFFIE